ncbi:MAG: hydroxymethylglutaryl-CoA reductase, degradative [Thermoplasmataceae archaeon]
MGGKSSSIPGLHKLSIQDRVKLVADFSDLGDDDVSLLSNFGSLPVDIADRMIENVISTIDVPLGVATNFKINGKDYLIPMAVEEASIIAACSNAAKIARASGGFTARASDPIMIGQIQIMNLRSQDDAKEKILRSEQKILQLANTKSKTLREAGAGAQHIELLEYHVPEDMLVVHLFVDVLDAMGANIVNSMCEFIAPYIEEITGGHVNLRILSNLSDRRMAYASAIFKKDLIGGEQVVKNIMNSFNLSMVDPYRAATHNKGIMNGIDAVLLATMNDWRAIEAGAHAFASLTGYKSLTRYDITPGGDLNVSIAIPIATGTVGGSTNTVPKARVARKILNVENSREFACVLASVGLAQNFAAVRALSAEGIQRGHMSLHARSIAITAGALGGEIDQVAKIMREENTISPSRAREILALLRKNS